MLHILVLAVLAQSPERSIAIDERLAADAGLEIGDRVVVAGAADAPGDTVRIGAITRRGTDPAEVARREYRIRLHLGHLQGLIGYGDRVDRFAVGTKSEAGIAEALARINAAAFGFRAHRSSDIAIETSRTFQVVSRFHRAIGVITILASAIFLLCIMLLKVDERRRDVAALRLLGVSRRTVLGTIVLEASLISLLGSAMGALLGAGMGWIVNMHYQGVYRTPLRFAILTPELVLFSVGLSILLGMVAGAVVGARLVRTPPLALFGR
jgi:putative ABC transport system permease protein